MIYILTGEKMLDFIIMGFLMMGNMSGYEIKRIMSMSTSFFYEASFGSIYPSLRRMEKKGLIRSTILVTGGKNKITYAINAGGRKLFMEWLRSPIDVSKSRPLQLVKIFFYGMLPKEKAQSLISEYVTEMEKLYKALCALEKTAKPHADFYQMSTLLFGKDYYKLVVVWYKRLLKVISRMKDKREEV